MVSKCLICTHKDKDWTKPPCNDCIHNCGMASIPGLRSDHFERQEVLKEVDNVNHPSHYENSCSLECIDVMKLILSEQGLYIFCIGNAFKYLWRYKNKNGKEDIKKAGWYLDYIFEHIDSDFHNRTFEYLLNLLDEIKEKEGVTDESD